MQDFCCLASHLPYLSAISNRAGRRLCARAEWSGNSAGYTYGCCRREKGHRDSSADLKFIQRICTLQSTLRTCAGFLLVENIPRTLLSSWEVRKYASIRGSRKSRIVTCNQGDRRSSAPPSRVRSKRRRWLHPALAGQSGRLHHAITGV